jgi:SAM-dependent methyltransferase
MKVLRFKSLEEYLDHLDHSTEEFSRRATVHKSILLSAEKKLNFFQYVSNWWGKTKKVVTFGGYSYTASSDVDFVIDVTTPINWRESVRCPKTGLINRVRGSIQLFETECDPLNDDVIYLMEQTTPTYHYLASKYKNLTGSEYIGDEIKSGTIRNGLRHEDVTALSFADDSLAHILSFDVFEHVPDYLAGFAECYRTLKPGGRLLWSVPMARGQFNNIIRAQLTPDGAIEHLLKPEYHGDPVVSEGILCFYHFGWEMLEQVRELGFSSVFAAVFWSDEYGYLGEESIFFIAEK